MKRHIRDVVVLGMVLICGFCSIQARSVSSDSKTSKSDWLRTWEADDPLGGKPSRNTIGDRNPTWTPSTGSRDEWLEYHGMSRDQWGNVMKTLAAIDHVESFKDKEPAEIRDLGVGPTDRVGEGCLWYTEEQAQEALDEAILERKHRENDVIQPEGDIRTKNDRAKSAADKSSENVPEESDKKTHSRQKRKLEDMEMKPHRKWSNPIMYKFDGSHTAEQQNIIRNAFKHWEQHTCMRFFEVNTDAGFTKEHLLLTGSGYGCYSFVGKTTVVPQQLNLAPVCLSQFGIPVHEIGHALGLWHEHQRIDRDEWIYVRQENIAYYSSQFWKKRTVSHNVPYDFGSVMHYAGSAASSGYKKYTLEPKDPLYQRSMGQRVELSYLDAKIINIEYCRDTCNNALPVQCARGGYQDPNDCYSCICPDGFGGRYCQEANQPTRASCGGTIELDKDGHQVIQSPGFDTGSYDDFTECSWVIKAPEDYKVRLTFDDDFGIYCHRSESCFHWVEVKYTTDFEYPGPRFCCYDNPSPMDLTSRTNEMAVIFKSNHHTTWFRFRRGFRATLEAVAPEGVSVEGKEKGNPNEEDSQTVTEVPTTTTTTVPPGTHWSEWSDTCTGHQCRCGSCSVQSRTLMCGKNWCKDERRSTETRPCDRPCDDNDKFLQYTGTFIRASCPICCRGYNIRDGICQPNDEE